MTSGYLKAIFTEADVVECMAAMINAVIPPVLEPHSTHSCSIVTTGLSGNLILLPLAKACHTGATVVRKECEVSHGEAVEGSLDFKCYVIVDDFISTGTTIKRVRDTVDAYRGREKLPPAQLLGLFMWHDSGSKYDARRLKDLGCEIPVFGRQRHWSAGKFSWGFDGLEGGTDHHPAVRLKAVLKVMRFRLAVDWPDFEASEPATLF